MNKLWLWLSGKKTFLIAAALILWAWAGVALGQHTGNHALELTLAALAAAGIRHGISRK